MERRSHRFAVLAIVVLLHVPLLFAIRDWLAPRFAPRRPARAMIVEFVLNDAAAPPPLVRRREEKAPPATATPTTSLPRHSRREPRPAATRDALLREPIATNDAALRESIDTNENPRHDVRLFADDGSLRIPSTLSEDVAPKIAEGPNTFHIPAGDTWVLREPRAPIEYAETAFARAFMPEDMNPVEEACWRNKGFAFIMTMLGSRECANPGGKDSRPTPAMIFYGVDDADDILRKAEEWERYNER